MESLDKKDNRASYLLILAFVLLAAGIITTGSLSYQNYENQYRVEVERQLSAIADLKVGELLQWRKERLGNAAVFYGNEAFSSLVHRYFNNPNDPEARRQLWIWLSKVQFRYSYKRLLLLDTRGALRMSVPDLNEPVASGILQRAAIVMHSEQTDFQDFYRDELDQRIYLTIMVPIPRKETGSQMQGVLVLRIDPETYLYPFIRYWPTPSQTAETLLARREGNEVVFLNDLRFQKDTALNLRFPLEKRDLPSVKAILGQEGIVEGKDYRGVPVIAAIRTIPNSPWFLSAHIDLSEIYGPLKERLYLTIILVVALLISIGTGIGLVWRQQHIRFYREKYEVVVALRESEECYRTLIENIPIAINWTTPPPNDRILMANPAFLRMFGIASEEEVKRIDPAEFYFNEAERDQFSKTLLSQGSLTGYEMRFRKADGTPVWGAITAQVVYEGNGSNAACFNCVTEDITERKKAEETIQRLAYYDSLTGLPNRTLFRDRFAMALARADRDKEKVVLMMFDLDLFKNVNDTMGHPVGDLLLKVVADRLQRHLRKSDTIARLGGDEFMVIYSGIRPTEQAMTLSSAAVIPSGSRPVSG